MTRERWNRIALWLFFAGGIAWGLKLIAIAANGGEGSPLEGILFIIGLATLLVGSSGIGGTLLLRAARPVYLAGCILSPVAFWFFFTFMDPVGRSVLSPPEDHWFYDETGILITAVTAAVVGLLLLRRKGNIEPGKGLP
ncbi:MAG TPA: hypothetical protein VNP73_07525 [Actinomycetota bacterium]|nr:hypothetical protein [Actinomycetota bacterium]